MKTAITLLIACAAFVLFLAPVQAQISLEKYCKDGYYQIPGEKKCSRAPNCGGKGYDELNKAELMPNNNDCLDEGRGMVVGDPPASSAFYGYVPLCCYEMERLKDPTMCIGYWERLWCHPDQCKAIDNDHGCGGGACQCAHAMKGWCETRKCNLLPPVPLEIRLGLKKPSPTPAPRPTVPPPPPTTPLLPTRPLPPPTAFPTRPPFIPPSSPLPKAPPPTSPPDRTATPLPAIPTTSQTAPSGASNQMIAQTVKTKMRAAVIGIDPLLRYAAHVFLSLKQTDRQLENSINQALASLMNSIIKPR